MPRTFLVTGANRGLGLEFVRQLAARDQRVFATAREPAMATELASIVGEVLPLDLADPGSSDALGRHLGGRPVDVLINNAGIASQSRSIQSLDAADLQRSLAINSIGPLLVTKALMPNLRASQAKTVFTITSQLGSIANNDGGSTYGYRASKAALNQLMVCLANELSAEGFTCVVAHPGWVRTDMGGPRAPLSPEESVNHLVRLIDRLRPEDSGKFFNYDGSILPW
jgi:NAD(P)-dependent dehydrogenase (short-subunit alcohol dehydrogenase family)